jgi:hypothetical protein
MIIRVEVWEVSEVVTFLAAYSLSALTLQLQSWRINHTWMLVLEFAQVIYILVNDDPEIVWFVMRRNVAL